MLATTIAARPAVLAGSNLHGQKARSFTLFRGQIPRLTKQRTLYRKDGESEANQQINLDVRDRLAGKPDHEQNESTGTQATLRSSNRWPSIAYGSLALSTTVAATTALIFPEQLSKLILNYTPSAMATTLIRLTGASLILDVASKLCLMEQQPVDRTDASARQAASQLNWALLVHASGTLVLLLQAVSVRNPALMATIGLLAATTTVVCGLQLYALRPLQSDPPAPHLTAHILAFFIPETLAAFVYSIVTATLAYGGQRLLYSWPGALQAPFSAPLDPVMTLCARATGWGFVLAALVALLLRDVADKPRPGKLPLLEEEAFRMLNLGLAGFMLVSAAVLALGAYAGVVATSSTFWWVTGTLAAIGAWAGYQSGTEVPSAPVAAGAGGSNGE